MNTKHATRSRNVMLSVMLSFFMIFSTVATPIISVHAEATVYITRTGSKYHTGKCGRGTYYPASLTYAKSLGLTQCEKCYGSSGSSTYSGSTGSSGSGSTNSGSSSSGYQNYTTATTSKPAPKPKKISLSKTSIELIKGQTKKLSVKNASGTVKWSTSDKSVATVSKGTVEAKGAGKATITVTANGQSKTCKVKVEAPEISKTSLSLKYKDTKKIKISGCKHDVKWKSNDKDRVKVDSNGKVTGKEPGKAVITGRVHGRKYNCKVTVQNPKITRLEADCDNLIELETYDYFTIKLFSDNNDIFAYIEPKVISSDESIVSIDDMIEDEIYIKTHDKEGSATISISIDGLAINIRIKVTDFDKEESTEPTEGSTPVKPTNPTDPIKPVPTEPTMPTESTKPTVEQNFAVLKNYILSNGDTDSEGNKFIKSETSEGLYSLITYDSSNKLFEFLLTIDKNSDELIEESEGVDVVEDEAFGMKINENNIKIANFYYTVTFSKSKSYGKCTASGNMDQIDLFSKLNWVVIDANMKESSLINLSNKAYVATYFYWDSFLSETVNLGLKDLGL